MTKVFVGVGYVDAEFVEERDSGGMFDSTVGVYKASDGKYNAFVKDWHGGVQSRGHDTIEAAKADIERLWDKMYG